MDFSSTVVNEDTMEKVSNMFIKQVSLGKGVIYVSSDDNFGLAFERNINVSNKFDVVAAGVPKKMHRIIRLGTSVYKK